MSPLKGYTSSDINESLSRVVLKKHVTISLNDNAPAAISTFLCAIAKNLSRLHFPKRQAEEQLERKPKKQTTMELAQDLYADTLRNMQMREGSESLTRHRKRNMKRTGVIRKNMNIKHAQDYLNLEERKIFGTIQHTATELLLADLSKNDYYNITLERKLGKSSETIQKEYNISKSTVTRASTIYNSIEQLPLLRHYTGSMDTLRKIGKHLSTMAEKKRETVLWKQGALPERDKWEFTRNGKRARMLPYWYFLGGQEPQEAEMKKKSAVTADPVVFSKERECVELAL